jgi:two-component sensor histidine kinase
VTVDTSAYAANLTQADADLLKRIRQALPILADISRSDLLLYVPAGAQEAEVLDQARPHSLFPLYKEDLIGTRVEAHGAPWVFSVLFRTSLQRGAQGGTVRDAPIVREVLPVLGGDGHTLAALSIETNLLAHERHRRRAREFRKALRQLQEMALRGELVNAEGLTPFGEHDGIVLVDTHRKVLYTSGIATNLFRRIGYMGNLLDRSLDSLDTVDSEVVDEALSHGACVQRETEQRGRIWIRKAIPIYVPGGSWQWLARRRADPEVPCPPGTVPVGVMLAVHDDTSARDKERELKAKLAMIQEVHHRVKNNLQSIASLLRLQERRSDSAEVRQALTDTVNRILSVAVVHEFLSYNTGSVINLLEVAQRIAGQMSQSVVDPTKMIQFRVTGQAIYLTSQQATACALVINELLQNAVEHGFGQRSKGTVDVALTDDGEWVGIEIYDDGTGLPHEFQIGEDSGLGLRIVRTLVEGDLKGKFEIRGDQTPAFGRETGVKAVVAFPKTSLGGVKS